MVRAKQSEMPTPESIVHHIVAATDTACERLDVFLAQQFPDIGTRSHAQRLIRDGMVVVNGVLRKASQPVHPADVVIITIPPEHRPNLKQKTSPCP